MKSMNYTNALAQLSATLPSTGVTCIRVICPFVNILRSSTHKGRLRSSSDILLPMASQDIRIHGLFASVINRVGLVGAACWGGSWRVSFGVEFGGIIRWRGLHADGVLVV